VNVWGQRLVGFSVKHRGMRIFKEILQYSQVMIIVRCNMVKFVL
jgi:hypothetical protein